MPPLVSALRCTNLGKLPMRWPHGGRALRIEPNNFIIRKQIWRIEYPEKFYPVIDYDWQKVKLAQEKAAESGARA